MRLRGSGIDLLGTRNAALREIVRQVPASIAATQPGYSHQVTQKHAAPGRRTYEPAPVSADKFTACVWLDTVPGLSGAPAADVAPI
jgi:hypothetical protein